MSDRDATLRALNDVHSFPGPFTLNIIGENSADFVERVVQAAIVVLGHNVYPDVSTRESAHGKHQSVTLVVEVANAEGEVERYETLLREAATRRKASGEPGADAPPASPAE